MSLARPQRSTIRMLTSIQFSSSIHDVLNFGIEHRMDIYSGMVYLPTTNTRHFFDQQLIAPFDDYWVSAYAFAIDKATNQSVHITRFATADPLDNFVTVSRDTDTVNEFTYKTANGTAVTIQAESRALEVHVRRSVLARAFTMCMLLVNWALTIGSLYVTLVMLVRRERMSEAVLALPITMVLTIPAIRSLFIGSPPFGILLGTLRKFLNGLSLANNHFSPRYRRVFLPDHSRRPLFAGADIRRGQTSRITVGGALRTDAQSVISLRSRVFGAVFIYQRISLDGQRQDERINRVCRSLSIHFVTQARAPTTFSPQTSCTTPRD